MNQRPNHNVRFELLGGLGNQLFQWAAANQYARVTGNNVILDLTYCSNEFKAHKSSILDLDFEDIPPLEYKTIKNSRSVFWLERLASRSKILNYTRNRIQKRYVSRTNGFDEQLQVTNSRIIRGYFQTFKYLERLSVEPIRARLSPNIRFTDKTYDPNAVAIHMRRGDYQELKNSFGILSNDYYFSALKKINEKKIISKVVIFSNDNAAAIELASLIGPSAEVHREEVSGSDASTLIHLSKFSSIIIANSSFSWWAAALNKRKIVVFPVPWFRENEVPPMLTPSDWIPCPSSWLD